MQQVMIDTHLLYLADIEQNTSIIASAYNSQVRPFCQCRYPNVHVYRKTG